MSSRASHPQSQQNNFASPSAAPITATFSVQSNNSRLTQSTASSAANGNCVGQIAVDLVELNQSGRLSVSQAALSSQQSSRASAAAAATQRPCLETDPNCKQQPFLSDVEQAILRSNVPVELSENEEITVLGQRGIWANRAEVVNWRGVIPIEEYQINEDAQPEIITKRTEQRIEYVQELAIRYLRPPTPPPAGEILIKQECNTMSPPAPPLIIRQQPARPDTPEPLVVREAPPQPPPQVCQKVITISGKRLPPPPRKVVIERLAPLPSKPQSVIVERWLPYAQVKRRVIFQRSCEPDAVACKPRNVIVQWEAPHVDLKKEVKYLGVIRANPAEYVQRYGASLKLAKDLPEFVLDISTPDGLVLAAEHEYQAVHELEGDLAALKLVDLDQEGLAEYRQQLARLGISYVGAEAAAELAANNASLDEALVGQAAAHKPSPSQLRSVASLHSASYSQNVTAVDEEEEASQGNGNSNQTQDSEEFASELNANESNDEAN